DEPGGVAVAHFHVAIEAPVPVELYGGAQAAVEVAVDLVAILVAGQRIAFEIARKRAARAGFHAPAVGAAEAAEIDLLVRHAGEQVGARGDLVVVAQADAPLVG